MQLFLNPRDAGLRAGLSGEMTNAMANVSQPLEFNVSLFADFLIHGGELGLKEIYTELAIFLLVVYIMVLIGNTMIITLVLLDSKLHTPMYILLCNLSFIDIMYTYLTFQIAEGFLLCVMAYDRYVAICNPLRYNSIITIKKCVLLASTAWALGMIFPALNVILASKLPFCRNEIMFWFCDYPPIVTLSCLDTTLLIDLALACALFVMYVPFTVICWSYCRIIKSICKIATSEGRKKAFSTCSSHLIVVLTFYIAHSCVYISAKSNNIHPNVLILISIVNCILTPLVNPLVYIDSCIQANVTVVTDFLFGGGERGFYLELVFLLVFYLMILIGKLIILTLVATDPKLQSAMYIFLSNLALIDINQIILTVCKIASSEGRIKAFSTCSAHLTVVLTFHLTHSCIYISAKSKKKRSLVPVMNPVIYSFRNKEIKAALRKLCSGNVGSHGWKDMQFSPISYRKHTQARYCRMKILAHLGTGLASGPQWWMFMIKMVRAVEAVIMVMVAV
ncbi:unnamed protein product [Coregonus sp. 'balchen']|nr:unnamed protein product [Coregonus sp. 'balchen']